MHGVNFKFFNCVEAKKGWIHSKTSFKMFHHALVKVENVVMSSVVRACSTRNSESFDINMSCICYTGYCKSYMHPMSKILWNLIFLDTQLLSAILLLVYPGIEKCVCKYRRFIRAFHVLRKERFEIIHVFLLSQKPCVIVTGTHRCKRLRIEM